MKASRRGSNPRARRENLVVERVGDEVLVYDLATQKAHCLNQAASEIWDACDGTRDVAAITARLRRTQGAAATPDLVGDGLRRLARAGLVEGAVPGPLSPSRRSALRKLAAGMALPVVASIVAPTVAQAGATCPITRDMTASLCNNSGQIYEGCCCTSNRRCVRTGTDSKGNPVYQCTGADC